MKPAYVIWLTGISGSGKTTLGCSIAAKLRRRHSQIEFLDGDSVRKFFGNDLGYSRRDRILNVKRIAFAAMLLANHGVTVVVANIAPYYEVRNFIRKNIKKYIQIYLRCSAKEAMRRDVKGHYRKHKRGKLRNIIGLDDAYEAPRNPDLVIDTAKETVKQSLAKIMKLLKRKGLW